MVSLGEGYPAADGATMYVSAALIAVCHLPEDGSRAIWRKAGESHGYVKMDESWATMVVYVAVAQVDERTSKGTMAEVLVNAVAKIGRDVANNAPENREAVGVDVVEDIVCGVNVVEDDQPDVNREGRRSHAPAVESLDDSASSYHPTRSGMLEEDRRQPLYACCCTSFGPIRRVEKCGGDGHGSEPPVATPQFCAAARDLKTSSPCWSLLVHLYA